MEHQSKEVRDVVRDIVRAEVRDVVSDAVRDEETRLREEQKNLGNQLRDTQANYETKMDNRFDRAIDRLSADMREFRAEMREETRAIIGRLDDMQCTTDSKFDNMQRTTDSKFDSIHAEQRNIQRWCIGTIIAIVVSNIGIITAVFLAR